MIRLFLGLLFGVILTICSFGFMGVGHGTYVPMVFTSSLIALITQFGAIPAIVLSPFLWALYFLFIPRFQTKWLRMASVFMVLSVHVLSGMWLAIEDPAFWRTLSDQLSELLVFGLLFATAITFLLYLAVRGSKRGNPLDRGQRGIGPIGPIGPIGL